MNKSIRDGWADGDPNKGIYVPPCPEIVIKIRQNRDDVNAVSSLVENDPGLSGEMLKIVNSPLYGLRVKVINVRKAVGLLGLDWVINIVIGLKLKANLGGDNSQALEHFWLSSSQVAMQARQVMRSLDLPWQDEAYLLGLIHNCGIPLMIRTFGATWESSQTKGYHSTESVTENESKCFHTHHARLGFLVAAAWGLTKPIVYAIRDHHERVGQILLRKQGAYADICYSHLWCVLKAAEYLCGLPRMYCQVEDNYEWERVAPTVMKFLDIDENRLEQMRLCEPSPED